MIKADLLIGKKFSIKSPLKGCYALLYKECLHTDEREEQDLNEGPAEANKKEAIRIAPTASY